MKRQKLTYEDHIKIARLLAIARENIFQVLNILEKSYGINSYPVRTLYKIMRLGGPFERAKSEIDNLFYIDGYGNMPNPYYSPDVRDEIKV